MQGLERHGASARTVPANDNARVKNKADPNRDAGLLPMAWSFKPSANAESIGECAAPGRTADMIALIAVLLWQVSFLLLLFALM